MGPNQGCPFFSDAVEILREVNGDVTDVEDEQLVVILMDDFTADGHQSGSLRRIEFAQEDAELDVLTTILENLEEFGAALVICYIIGAEVKAAVVV